MSIKLISPSFDGQHVLFNGLRAFGDVFKVVFELLDMTTRWLSIGVDWDCPRFKGGFRLGDEIRVGERIPTRAPNKSLS